VNTAYTLYLVLLLLDLCALVGILIGHRDCPTKVATLQASAAYGMSYELADAHVEDIRAPIWKLTAVTFTGAAILLRAKAAYRRTDFVLM